MALPIAIVEDQTLDAQRLEELLQPQLPEAECTWFTCGDDFLRAAAEPGLYAVVFLDICMAGTNGIETARRLRQANVKAFTKSSAVLCREVFLRRTALYYLSVFSAVFCAASSSSTRFCRAVILSSIFKNVQTRTASTSAGGTTIHRDC